VAITVNTSAVESGAASPPVTLALGDSLIEVEAVASGGQTVTYRIATNRGRGVLQQAYIKASNTEANDGFGSSVAISGDTLVLGAPEEDSSATTVNGNQTNNNAENSGAVYVFVRDETTWFQQAYLKASNSDAGDRFGTSIAISGDTVVVGAPVEDSSATGIDGDQTDNSADRAGAAYVFIRNGTTWSQQAYIKASNTDVRDGFGSSVAISGDTVAVAAVGEDSSATGIDGDQADNSATIAGAIYVFARSGTTWSQEAYVKASNTEPSDSFGTALALSGETLVVAAPEDDSSATGVNGDQADNSATGSGAVYVFVRTGESWSQQAYIKASNTGVGDLLGLGGVAVSGDILAVGTTFEDSSATGINGDQDDNSASLAGAVYVFARSGTTWAQEAYLKASNNEAGDQFGAAIALSGEILAVGASQEASSSTGVNGNQADNGAEGSGAVYLFLRSDERWTQAAYLKASNGGAGDGLSEVTVSENTLACTAPGESSSATGVDGDQDDNGQDGAGALYVFQ
jgi:hypothetical protein